MSDAVTVGRVIAERRRALGLSLKDLGRLVQNEAKDGRPLSPQFLHDTEHDLRTPGIHLLRELGRALGLDPHYLSALAGHAPPEVVAYLRERPQCGPAIAALFARARASGFTDWDRVAPLAGPTVAATAAH